ncbi:hypothetical protein X551_03450 [Methylibium sp. T29]|nr:hypothetical protein X551_03450 [Methylibium sp. T29]
MDETLGVLRQRLGQQAAVGCVDARIAPAFEQQLSLRRVVAAQQRHHLLRDRGAGGDHEALAFHGVDAAGGGVHLRAQRMGAAAVEREAGPGGDVHLLVLRVHRVLRQRLQMLPAAQRADASERGVVHAEVAAVALAEHGALHVRGLELAAPRHRAALGVDDPLAHVEAAAGLLAVAHHDHDGVVAGRLGDAIGLRRAVDQRVIVVALDELQRPGRRIEPDEPRVAGQPGFRKGHELRALRGGLGDQAHGLVDRRVEVQEHRRSLDGGSAELGVRNRHGEAPVVQWSGACDGSVPASCLDEARYLTAARSARPGRVANGVYRP